MSIYQFPTESVAKQDGDDALRLLVKGFTQSERQMLAAIVKLSQRRRPKLHLLDELDGNADVVMIDAKDATAMTWAGRQQWLARKVVIWVDAVGAHGGFAASRPIQWASLPMLLVRAMEQVQTRTASVPAATTTCKSVLVVDDSAAVRGQLRSLLEARGLIVTEAENGDAALAAVRGSTFAAIFMDVLMPGIDGYEACRLIKASARGKAMSNVVMLTGRTSPFDRIRGKMAGCDAYLTKPVDSRQLHEMISRFVPSSKNGGASSQQTRSLQYAE